MNTKLTKIADLKVNDRVVDNEGLVLVIKNIEVGKKVMVETNYAEQGFYRTQNTVKVYKLSAMCYKLF